MEYSCQPINLDPSPGLDDLALAAVIFKSPYRDWAGRVFVISLLLILINLCVKFFSSDWALKLVSLVKVPLRFLLKEPSFEGLS